MELYKTIIAIVDANLMYCLIPIILTLLLVELLFKKRYETGKAMHLVCRFIILYTIITFAVYLIGMALNPKEYAFIQRAQGPYAMAYWMMFLSSLLFPFTLCIKKFASKFWYVMLVAFFMKSGFYFERYVILVTRFHRDYLSENEDFGFSNSFLSGIGLVFLQGILIALLVLGVFEIMKRKKLQAANNNG
ncbi:hypothetical protein [Flavobacterium humi]|uniref:DUF1361 domain-containing protein n=1 Tax=Flavobacterium humi TaxID=2562683 RepID=A0A4Z0LDE2_9FLAO|nr:hypothetical protein [Flavobacterium humi]TGD59891.1 hypothetical protein E4635_02875 [Flavobacterium humi]